jgi:4-carboxymuconolactone decarboxylase
MNELNLRERELVALGAAMGSNCIPCIEYHIPEARKTGLTDSQISEAIRLADKVREVPARRVLETARRMLPGSSESVPAGGKPGESAQAAVTGRACCG